MSFVPKITEEQAPAELKPLFGRLKEHYGFVPNYFQAQGRHPKLVARQMQLAEAVLGEGALSAAHKEEILLVVSGLNSSSYCVRAHLQMLHNLGVEESLGRQLAVDYAAAPVGARDMALFEFAAKLTQQPDEITQRDVDALRRQNWSEDALIETVLTVAWANFVNRVALGLGLFMDE
jgi:uncharacterized peroxidase-related enzyme